MSEPLILAIDLGASSVKVGLVNIYGKALYSTSKPIPTIGVDQLKLEHFPHFWWKALDQAMSWVLIKETERKKDIVGISTTSQWSNCVLLGKDKKVLNNGIQWTTPKDSQFLKALNKGSISLGRYSPAKTLRWIRKTNSLPWLSEHESLSFIMNFKESNPDEFERVRHIINPKDYINFRLTGSLATSADTMASYWITHNKDSKNITYDKSLLSQTDLEKNLFPPIISNTSPVGELKSELVEYWGLAKKTLVFCGSPERQCAIIGAGLVSDFDPYFHLGSDAWATCHTSKKVQNIFHQLSTLPSAIEGKYFIRHQQEKAACCLAFVRSQFLMKSLRSANKSSFDDIEEAARATSPGAQSLLFTPLFKGESSPFKSVGIPGNFHNMRLHHKQNEFIRSVYEGVAYNSKRQMLELEKFCGKAFDSISLAGGGAASRLWCQIHADVSEKTIHKIKDPQLCSLRGAALLGLIGLNQIAFSDIKEFLEVEESFFPKSKDS